MSFELRRLHMISNILYKKTLSIDLISHCLRYRFTRKKLRRNKLYIK